MHPIEIKKIDDAKLQIIWLDGFCSEIMLRDLRDNCPCAQCQGEELGFKKVQPMKLDVVSPGKYELSAVEPVGNYALQFIWKDGHDTGIYSYEYLRSLMERYAEK